MGRTTVVGKSGKFYKDRGEIDKSFLRSQAKLKVLKHQNF